MRLAAAAALVLAAAPAAAQELTAETVWELFVAGCEAALAGPADDGAVAAAVGDAVGGGQTATTTTPDGWGTQGVAMLRGIDIGDGSGFASFNHSVVQAGEGSMGYCTFQVIRPDAGPVEGIEAVFDARHGELIADGTRRGGVISAQGDIGLWVAWTAPGFPPDTVSLRTFSPMTMLTLNRYLAERSD